MNRTTSPQPGDTLRWLDTVDSTNDALALWSKDGAPDGATLAADAQTAGRGRLGHRWVSPPGLNLAASILLETDAPPDRLCTLPLLAGLAVARTIARLAPDIAPDIAIKWPNDVWCHDRKLCGILCEVAPKPPGAPPRIIAGIGVNMNSRHEDFPEALRPSVTSLSIETGREWDRRDFLLRLRDELLAMRDAWEVRGLSPFLAELQARDALEGRALAIESGSRTEHGVAAGIAESGELLLRQPGGTLLPIVAGDVHIVRQPDASPSGLPRD
ncbi:MAG: biotin--[acetyl-CoA-carboxylase] ligase [Kiritimatiellia bacterium]